MPDIGVPELLIVLVIVVMLFGVGKLPEVFGSLGKGVREFRKEMEGQGDPTASAPALTVDPAPAPPSPDAPIGANPTA